MNTDGDTPVDARPAAILQSDFATANPPTIDIPAMICQPEKNYYYWLTSNLAPGVGAVVEFGTWLGASTAYLSAGLKGRPMHCFDHFEWFGYDNWKSHIKLEDGVDFQPLFTSNMERYGANVVVHKTKLEKAHWDGGPVELLILDAPKQAHQLAGLLSVFAPSFIPGQTRIVLQDYQHFPSYELAILMDAIRDSVALEHVVIAVNSNLQPNTVAFLVVAPIDVARLATVAAAFKAWPAEQIRAAWSRIMAPLPEQARARMAPGLALFLYDAGHYTEARAQLTQTPMDRTMLKRWRRLCGEVPYFDFPDRYRGLVALMNEIRPDPDRPVAAVS